MLGKERGVKTISGINYIREGEFFFETIPKVMYYEGNFVLYSNINVKPYILDDLFWEIFEIESNKKAPMSLRANGAYVAPSIKLEVVMIKVNPEEDLEKRCKEFIDDFERKIETFLKKVHDVESYFDFVEANHEYKYNEFLFILLEIQLGNYLKAKEMLDTEIAAKKHGGFSAGNKSIYQFAKEYCIRKTVQEKNA